MGVPDSERLQIELLIYGIFSAYDGDKGKYSTAWVLLSDTLMALSRETIMGKLSHFRDGLAKALDVALIVPTRPATLPRKIAI